MIKYDRYNREERAICAHLFRLLHEKLDNKAESPLGQFIKVLSTAKLIFRNGEPALTDLEFKNPAIFCEVAIIRDAYQNLKPNVNPFMDKLTKLIMKQEGVTDCRLYSQLPDPLPDIYQTHPKQIRQKATSLNITLSEGESKVFGAMQGMFNAKPDLAIRIDNTLLVCEAKFTESFDEEQLLRTWNISEVWASLLYEDFGFITPPSFTVFKLGVSQFRPDITWSDILEIAEKTYSQHDRTRISIKAGKELIDNYVFERNNKHQH
jgi:hypothetical protein